MRFCSNCGNPVGGSPWYCAGCGAPINPGPVRDVFAARPAGSSQPAPLQADQEAPGYPSPASLPDPWTPGNPVVPPTRAAPGIGSAAPMWFDQPAPVGRPQPDGPAGAAAPVSDPLPAAVPATRRRRLSSGQAMTITATLTTLALLATGGVAAWQVHELHSRLHRAAASLPTGRAQPSSPATSARPSSTAPAASTEPSPGARGRPVSVTTGAAGRPHLGAVLALLDSYFAAINRHDFLAYRRLFIPAIQASLQHFGAGYASTVDSAAELTGLIVTGPEGLAARVTFTSHQKPAASPNHAACDHWDITLFLKHRAGQYQIRRPRPGFPQSVRACS
jgi:hypothetical protein